MKRNLCISILCFALVCISGIQPVNAAIYTVTNTGDNGGIDPPPGAGTGTLRQAIVNANLLTPGIADIINFNILPGGFQTIMPLTQLPELTDPAGVFINGFTQPGGATPGGNPPSTAVLLIEIDGTVCLPAPPRNTAHGFILQSSNNTIQGLIINSFRQNGVYLPVTVAGTANNTIYCNFIGTDNTGNPGSVNHGNGWDMSQLWAGVYLGSLGYGTVHDNFVDKNLVSTNYAEGVAIVSCPTDVDVYANHVTHNYIGTNISGMLPMGNTHDGVYIGEGAHHNLVDGNLISANGFEGICIVGYQPMGWDTHDNMVANNIIGLTISLTPLSNASDGVSIGIYGANQNPPYFMGGYTTRNTIGPNNVIAYNGRNGVLVWEIPDGLNINADKNRITQNMIYSNNLLGIDLGNNNVTLNDPNDPDMGADQELNFPVITSAVNSGGQTIITGTLNIDTNPANAVVELFKITTVDPSGYGEGDTYIAQVTPGPTGNWTATVPAVAMGSSISATATDVNNNTSEFSQAVAVTGQPVSQPIDPDPAHALVQNEISMALLQGAQPGVPAVLLAAYNDHPYPGGPGLGVSTSNDGGATWNSLQLPYPPDPYSGGFFVDAFDPTATADAVGNLYVAHISTDYDWTNGPASGLYVHKSTDGGVSWTGPVAVATDLGAVTSPDPNFRFNDRCQITADVSPLSPNYNNLYIVEIKDRGWNSPSPWSDIYFSRSTDGGASWSPQSILNGPQSNMANMPVPAVAPDGTIYVSWLDYNVQTGGAGIIFLDRSTDGGLTWLQNDIQVIPISVPPIRLNNGTDVLAKGAPVIHTSPFNSQEVYIVFAEASLNYIDEATIVFIKSTDGGVTWSVPVTVNDNFTNDQILPWMDVKPNGMIDIAWYDRRNDPNDLIWDVYMTTSQDGGNSFAPNIQVNTVSAGSPVTPSGLWMGEYPGLVVDQTYAYICYTMGTPDINGDIYFNKLQNPELGLDFGDAPEGATAYPSTGIAGAFPTCKTTGPAGWIQHTQSNAYFGPLVDLEADGNAGLCPVFLPTTYDQDECSNDGDAGLIMPSAFTFTGTLPNIQVVPCAPGPAAPLGNACQWAAWGLNVDILVNNQLPNQSPAFVNLLVDWNQDGQWGGTSVCPGGATVSEHVLTNFAVPNGFTGALSALGPPPFLMGPNQGYAWTRFTITGQPIPVPWDGSGTFNDGETEDYLLLAIPGDTIPDSLLLQNIVVTPAMDTCFEAVNKITVAGNGTSFIVQNGGKAHLIASQQILMFPQTKVYSGGRLHAYITTDGAYCNNIRSVVAYAAGIPEAEKQDGGRMPQKPVFKVYPNPTTGMLTLELADNALKATTVVEIYGMMGDRIMREEFTGLKKHEFSLATQPPGIYFLRIITGSTAGTVKVIRQ